MRGKVRTRSPSRPLSQTLEREISEILTHVAPRRQPSAQNCRVISMLCVRVSGFIALCEGIDPEQVGAVLALYAGAIADSVGTYFGTLNAAMGDCILASWNAAVPQPDHALLAVSAAIDMIERTDDINRRLLAEGLPEIACAIGVNTGDALVRPSSLQRGAQEIVGDSVNVASLLAEAAPPGCILVAEGTKVSIGNEILLEPVDDLSLPGKTKPVRIFKVLGRLTTL